MISLCFYFLLYLLFTFVFFNNRNTEVPKVPKPRTQFQIQVPIPIPVPKVANIKNSEMDPRTIIEEVADGSLPIFRNKPDFKTIRKLGSGSFGDVYLVNDRSSANNKYIIFLPLPLVTYFTIVISYFKRKNPIKQFFFPQNIFRKAVKILKDSNSCENSETQRTIIAEVSILKKLDSLYVIKYFDFFKYDDDVEKTTFMCILTEYCDVIIIIIIIFLVFVKYFYIYIYLKVK